MQVALETISKWKEGRLLDLSRLGLYELPPIPSTVTRLRCAHNHLTKLSKDSLPPGLIELDISSNKLSSISEALVDLTTLKILNCSFNLIKTLPSLPPFLKELQCSNNGLVEIGAIPETLEIFHCDFNSLSSLPIPSSLSPRMKELHCSYNLLMQLPDALPRSLTTIVCNNNLLEKLPVLPPNLVRFHCIGNKLTSLPPLPDSIRHLECRNNKLTELPAHLPSSLELLGCNGNQLIKLPELPDTLKVLWCAGNCLTSLPPIPPSLKWITCGYNCFPVTPLKSSLNCYEEIEEFFNALQEKEEHQSQLRIKQRCNKLKEELVSTVWNPKRLEQLLAKGVSLEEIIGSDY